MSGQSFNHYMRPQDRDGSNHAGGRGRSRHRAQSPSPSPSRGRSRGRSYDFHDGRDNRHDNRGMRYDARSDRYHRSMNSGYAPHSWSHRSPSCDPHLSRQTSKFSSNHPYQRNSSHSRKRSRSPERRHHDTKIDDRHERSSRPRSVGDGRLKDVRSYDYERYPLALTSTSGAGMHRPQANENYVNASYGSDMNMDNRHTHYNPQSRYHYEHSKGTSRESRPLAYRQNFSSNPALQQRKSTPSFHNNHTIPQLIQIAHDNLAILKPPSTAAFWNKVSKQMEANKQPSPSYHEQTGSYFNKVYEHTRNTLSFFSVKDLSQTIYSMAKLVDAIRKNRGRRSGRGGDIVDILSRRFLNSDMTPRKELFLSLAYASRDKLDDFEARYLSNIAYAYALMKYVPEIDDGCDLFDHLAKQAVRRGTEFNAQDISNIVWAYATVDKPHAILFEAMGDQVVANTHLGDFKPQELSNTVWAFAKAGIHHPKLFDTVAYHIVQSNVLDRFSPQALSNTIWAYATSQFIHPMLFHDVAKTAVQRKDGFNSQEIANLLWSYATMSIIDKQLFLSFEIPAANLVDACTNQNLFNLAWAYAVADVDAPTLFNKDFIKKLAEKKDRFEVQHYSQLHQWHLWQTKEKCSPGLPTHLQESCFDAFVSRDPHVSDLQQNVVAHLTSIGLEPKEEVLMDSGYRIDAIVEVNGKRVGIEVDGPHHFIGRSESPLARTILKRRQVPLIDGIELVSVPYWEWNKLDKDEVKEQEYLRMLLGL